jgi:A/G-specific adenine glycosylase
VHGWPDDLTELPGVGPYTAAAVRNFAFGHDVLPVDTNVRRVQDRTGETFDGSCAQALFDLGATVCLARIPRCDTCPLAANCPSRGSRYEPLRKQSAFEGSFRQRRSVALRAVAAGEQPTDGEALVSLARDGLVVLREDSANLPG